MKKIKILFTLTQAFNPNDGGVQRTTFKLGKKFTELGHIVSYFSFKDKGNLDSDYGKLYHALERNGVNNIQNLEKLKEVLKTFKPDFVINQMPYESNLSKTLFHEKSKCNYILLGCLRNSLFSVKNNIRDTSKRVLPKPIFGLLNSKIGLYILLQFHRFNHRKQLKEILDLHDKFILLAPPNIDELNYFVGDYKKEKVTVIPNSIPNVYNETLIKEKIILHVGRLNIPQKRSDLLLEFWKRANIYLHDWEFIVVGDGPYKKEIENQINKQDIPRIRMLGYQQPEYWYKRASMFVMTSAYEGFPNVILEAQSYGCVPIAFKSYDAISWIVHDRLDALLFEPYNVDEMSEEVTMLAENNDQLSIMAEESKINASQFVVDKVAQMWMTLFESFDKV